MCAPRLGNVKDVCSALPSEYCTGDLSQCSRENKIRWGMEWSGGGGGAYSQERKIKLSLFADNMVFYTEDFKDYKKIY